MFNIFHLFSIAYKQTQCERKWYINYNVYYFVKARDYVNLPNQNKKQKTKNNGQIIICRTCLYAVYSDDKIGSE